MFNNEFPPLGGGTGTVNEQLFYQFSDYQDMNIDLISSARGNNRELINFSENICIYKIPVNNKNIHHSSNSELVKYSVKALLLGIKLLRKNNYDLIFAWSSVPAGFVSLILKLFFNKKLIVRISGPDIPGFEKRYEKLYRIIKPIIKLIWKKSDSLIVKCRQEYEMVKKINPHLRISIIYNGVDTKKFTPKKNEHIDKFRLICSARLIKRKGQNLIIEAISMLKKEKIIVYADFVGDGDEIYKFQSLANELKVTEQIRFCGYVSREEIVKYYHKADVFVLPSFNEGMSNSLLEAMACGLPVVVTDVGGSEELVENKKNGYLVSTGNSIELANAIKEIFMDDNYLKMGKESLRIISNFTPEKLANQYFELFQKTIK
jgi:phosphatidyl-myo-inositol dimannoside synthase